MKSNTNGSPLRIASWKKNINPPLRTPPFTRGLPIPIHPTNTNITLPIGDTSRSYRFATSSKPTNSERKSPKNLPQNVTRTPLGLHATSTLVASPEKAVGTDTITPLEKPTITTIVPTEVDFKSVLRLRPFTEQEKEREDSNKNQADSLTLPEVQDDDGHTVLLYNKEGKPVEKYSFDEILPPEATQKDTYDRVGGLGMTWDAMNPLLLRSDDRDHTHCVDALNIQRKNHVIVSIGISNSGKTHTIFGHNNASSHEKENEKMTGDGIVPRIIDDLFIAEKDENMERMLMQTPPKKAKSFDKEDNTKVSFGVQMSMVHLHNDRVFDMLSSYSSSNTLSDGGENGRNKQNRRLSKGVVSNVLKMAASFETRCSSNSKKNYNSTKVESASMSTLRINQNAHTQDFYVTPTNIICPDSSYAKEVLRFGLKNSIVSSTSLNEYSSRGHTMITLTPVISRGNNTHEKIIGGSITIMDLAGIERTKNVSLSDKTMKESVAINKSISGVLQCLRTIKKHNHTRRGKAKGGNDNDIQASDSCQQSLPSSPCLGKSPENSRRKNLKLRLESRQNKLTMLMQPLFSGSIGKYNNNISKAKTNVILLLSAYPGFIDYHEKKSLLKEIDALRGMSIVHTKKQTLTKENISSTHTQNQVETDSPNIYNSRRYPLKRLSNEVASVSDKKRRVIERGETAESPDEEAFFAGRNNVESTPDSAGKKRYTKSSPLKRIGNVVTSMSGKKRRVKEGEMEALMIKLSSLEEEVEYLREKNQVEITRCNTLAKENKNLKKLLENMKEREGERMKETKETHSRQLEETKDRMIAREVRIRKQNLLESPLRKHMELVKNGGVHLFDEDSKVEAVLNLNLHDFQQRLNQSNILQSDANIKKRVGKSQFNLAHPRNESSKQSDLEKASYLELLSCMT